jgi:hypothetical protein
MPRTLGDWLAGALLRWRLRSRVRRRTRSTPRSNRMNLDFLDGYKTYIIAVAMLVAGIAQLTGVDLPSFEGQSAGHLIMEALAVIFLRRGIKAAS